MRIGMGNSTQGEPEETGLPEERQASPLHTKSGEHLHDHPHLAGAIDNNTPDYAHEHTQETKGTLQDSLKNQPVEHDHSHLSGKAHDHPHFNKPGSKFPENAHSHEANQTEKIPGHDHGHSHEGIHTGEPHEHDHAHAHGKFSWLREILPFGNAHSHDAADSVDDALAGSAEGIRAVKVALLGLGVTSLLQLVVVLISGSVALLADTIHNFADAATAIPLWLAFSLSRKPPTRRYT